MRMLILTTTAMSTLALAACDQPSQSAAPPAADNAIDAVPIDKNAPPPAPVVQAPRPTRAATPAPASSPDAEEDVVPSETPTGGMTDDPGPEVQDGAEPKAESITLKPTD